MATTTKRRRRRIVVVLFDQVEALDVTGPVEVFDAARRLVGDAGYVITVASPAGGPVGTTSGLRLDTEALGSVRGPVDTLVVAGGFGVHHAIATTGLVRHVDRLASRARRVCSVCTGAFVLAHAGWLAGRRATTHWAACAQLAAEHPDVTVEPDPIFVRDGDVWTSAGVTAGMDLALALVEDDLGPDVALEVARWLVLFVRRPGGQAQFSASLAAQAAKRRPLRELQAWLPDHLTGDVTVPALARRVHMSERTFARAFAAETGTTPAAHVERLRVEAARRLLETTADPVAVIARRCGFARVETLHRAFRRALATSPELYRRHFGGAA